MLRALAIFAACIAILTVTVWDIGISSCKQPPAEHSEASETNNSKKEDCSSPYAAFKVGLYRSWRFVGEYHDEVIAVGTVFVAIFTIILGLFTVSLAGSTQELVREAKKTSECQLRAYISLKHFQPAAVLDQEGGTVQAWQFTPIWENSGVTFTQNMFNHTNLAIYQTGSPENTDFADIWAPGVAQEHVRMIAGPKTTINGESVSIAAPAVIQCQQTRASIFLWGWTEYDDVFAPKTPRHRTEFCALVDFFGNPTLPTCHINFRFYRSHNGADEETTRQSSPRQ